MTILICKKFFDINVIFFFSGKNIFWGVFFMCLNLVKSQKVIKIFEKLFLHVMLEINCGIFPKELSNLKILIYTASRLTVQRSSNPALNIFLRKEHPAE